MTIGYLYGKFFKQILCGKCVINSQIHKTAKINSGATIVDSTIGRYTYTCYDDEIVNCEIGQFCSISDDVIIGGLNILSNGAQLLRFFRMLSTAVLKSALRNMITRVSRELSSEMMYGLGKE